MSERRFSVFAQRLLIFYPMNTKVVTAALLGTIVGLIGGFILANSINRSEINNLKARPEQQGTAPGGQKQNDVSVKKARKYFLKLQCRISQMNLN